MWATGGLHAIDGDEKMDEYKEDADTEESGDEEQEEEEHRNSRAMASPASPSRREVEDHNLTHVPIRSWCEGEDGEVHSRGDTMKEEERTTEL